MIVDLGDKILNAASCDVWRSHPHDQDLLTVRAVFSGIVEVCPQQRGAVLFEDGWLLFLVVAIVTTTYPPTTVIRGTCRVRATG